MPTEQQAPRSQAYFVYVLVFLVIGTAELIVKADGDRLFGGSMLLCGISLVLYERGKQGGRRGVERAGIALGAVAVAVALFDVALDVAG